MFVGTDRFLIMVTVFIDAILTPSESLPQMDIGHILVREDLLKDTAELRTDKLECYRQ